MANVTVKKAKTSIKNSFFSENCTNLWDEKPCEKYADFYFVFKHHGVEKRLPCHKAILASSSKVFNALFETKKVLNQNNEEVIKDVSYDVFLEFLQFFYLPDVTLLNENLELVTYLADKYEVEKCLKICERYLIQQSTLEEVCNELNLALKLKLDELKEHCLKTITDETKKVLASEGFLECSNDALKCILELNSVYCEEFDLFDACIKWAKNACKEKDKDSEDMENLKNELGDCWYAIRFGAMEKEKIGECYKKNPGLFNQNELDDLFSVFASNDKYPMKIFKNTTQRLKPAPLCFPELHGNMMYSYKYNGNGGIYAFNQIGSNISNYKLTQSGKNLIKEKLSLHPLEGLTCTTCSAIISDYKDYY